MQRRHVSRLMLAAAALMWLAALALPTTAGGAGSAIPGHQLAGLIASGTLGALAPRWLGFAWYAMPLAGAVVLTALASDRPLPTWSRLGAAALGATSAIGCAAALTSMRPSRFGLGTWCAVGGALAALAGMLTAAHLPLEARHAAR